MTILTALGRVWWLVPIGALLALVVHRDAQLADRDATIATDREARARADHDRAAQELGFATTAIAAIERQAARADARAPIILRSTDTVREYAQTDAGRARCLGADRVRGLDTYLSALAGANTAAASGGAEAVRPDADPAPAGRYRQLGR